MNGSVNCWGVYLSFLEVRGAFALFYKYLQVHIWALWVYHLNATCGKSTSFTINLHVGVTFMTLFQSSSYVLMHKKKKKSCCLHFRETANRHLTPSRSLFCPKACTSPPTALLYHTPSVKDSFPNMSSWSFSSVTSLATSLLLQPLSITPTSHLSPPHLTAKHPPSFFSFFWGGKMK